MDRMAEQNVHLILFVLLLSSLMIVTAGWNETSRQKPEPREELNFKSGPSTPGIIVDLSNSSTVEDTRTTRRPIRSTGGGVTGSSTAVWSGTSFSSYTTVTGLSTVPGGKADLREQNCNNDSGCYKETNNKADQTQDMSFIVFLGTVSSSLLMATAAMTLSL